MSESTENLVSLESLENAEITEKTVVPEYKIVNAYEDIVKNNVRDIMSKMDMCNCEKCFLDACAIVFNRGFNRFVTTPKGEVLGKLPDMNHSNHVELVVAVTDALQLVKNSPNH